MLADQTRGDDNCSAPNGHTKAVNSSILSPGLSTAFHHYEQTLAIDQMLLQCAILQESRNKYYTVDALKTFFGTIPRPCILQFLSETLILYVIVIWTIK